MSDSPDWRRFEKLVERITAIALPRGAVVKSPDHISDVITGKPREVDVSIRYTVCSVDLLITIECRKHSRVQDVTWIEQLATKRSAIGANKTIAVSATGFSDAAKQTATRYAIELRTLTEVDASHLEDWFLPQDGIGHVIRRAESLEYVLYLQCSDGDPLPYGVKPPDVFEPIFQHDLIQSPFPAAVLFKFLEMTQPTRFRDLPLDGSLTKIEFLFKISPGQLYVLGKGGIIPVHHTYMSALVGYQVTTHRLESGMHHRYSILNGKEIQHSTFHSELLGIPIRIDIQRDTEGEENVLVSRAEGETKRGNRLTTRSNGARRKRRAP